MKIDERLVRTAEAMIRASAKGKDCLADLQEHAPGIYRQLVRVGKQQKLLGLWGKSQNYDEYAKSVIVEPPILECLGKVVGVPMSGLVVHAGLEHTYGYLFSLIQTPYGTKRSRWTTPTIDQGLGLPRPTLRAEPAVGTLLGNLTWILARFALRHCPTERQWLAAHPMSVSKDILSYPFDDLDISTLIESVSLVDSNRKVRIFTDLVRFPAKRQLPGDVTHLLIYSVEDSLVPKRQLITAFAVTDTFVKELRQTVSAGDVPVRTHYNCHVDGITGSEHVGTRTWDS